MANSKNQEMTLFGDKSEQLPAFMQEDASMGNENIDPSTLAIPQIKLLQALSPELRDYKDSGADVGKLFNTVTKESLDSIVCANLAVDTYFTVWKSRESGGGKEGEFATETEALQHIQSLDRPEDYSSQETHKHHLILLNPSTGELISPAVIYMKNTQLTVSRAWNTELVNKKAPRFASIWELGSRLEQNKRRDEYANYITAWRGWASQQLYAELKANYVGLIGSNQQTAA